LRRPRRRRHRLRGRNRCTVLPLPAFVQHENRKREKDKKNQSLIIHLGPSSSAQSAVQFTGAGQNTTQPLKLPMCRCRLPTTTLTDRPFEEIPQFRPGRRGIGRLYGQTRPHHDINAGSGRAGMAKNIPCEPLEVIACDGGFHDALAHNHAQPRFRRTAGPCIYLEPLPAHPALVSKHGGVSVRTVKASRAGKSEFLAPAQVLDGEARAPFGTTGADDCATCPGFHAHTKTVRAFASCRRRLISPFHDLGPVNVKSPLLQPLTPIFVNVNLIRAMSAYRPRLLVDNSPQKR
jgi:hypothetical protein